MPAEKPVPRTSDARRSNKPIMEKRRRARINQCLNELKSLILEALRKDPSRHSKLEKADILEMTVKHLQNVQRQQMALAMASDPTVMSKFRSGFSECAGEVSRYVSRIDGVEPGVRQRLLAHLGHCLSSLNGMNPLSVAGILPSAGATGGGGSELLGQMPHVHMSHALNVYPQLPFSVGDLNNNNTNAAAARLLNSLSFIPGRLLTAGDIALLVPGNGAAGGGGGGGGGVAAHLPASLLPLFSPSAPTPGSTPSATVTCDSDTVLNALKSEDDNNSAFTAIARGCLASGPLSPVSTASTCTSGSSAFSPPLRDASPEPDGPSIPADSSSDGNETSQTEEAGTSNDDATQPSTSANDGDKMWRPW